RKALHASTMYREPARREAPANAPLFALDIRLVVARWKLLFFRKGSYQPDPTQSEAWMRSAYLVEGLAHCGGCHTPRNALGPEEEREDLAGGTVEGWRAPALNEASPAPSLWTAEQLVVYLRTGFDAAHGTAAGAVAPVAHNLSSVPEAEVSAIAVYIAARMASSAGARATAAGNAPGSQGAALVERSARGDDAPPADLRPAKDGDAIYRTACADCHDGGQRGIALGYSSSM